jgi:hypothetical protein
VAKTRFLLIIAVILPLFLSTAETVRDQDLLAKIDGNFLYSKDIAALLTVIKNKATEWEDVEEYYYFRRDREGLLLLLQKEPQGLKGRAYLQKQGELLCYNPYGEGFSGTIPTEHIAGSLATIADIARSNLNEEYILENYSGEALGAFDVYALAFSGRQSSPKEPYISLWVTRDQYLPLKKQVVDKSGRVERTLYYVKYTRIDESIYPVSIYIEDGKDPAANTWLVFSAFNTQPIPDYIFTRAYLEEINK